MADDAKQALIDGLNEDLAAEYQAIIFYTVAAQLMTGADRPELKALFESEVADEQGHAELLARKIIALGGEPTTEPAPVRLGSSNEERVRLALEAEVDTISRYRQRIKQAEAAGETGLQVRLEDLVADETEHKEEMEMILRDFHG